jgi:hypothetical protein
MLSNAFFWHGLVALQSIILMVMVFQRSRDRRAVREMDTWIVAILRALDDLAPAENRHRLVNVGADGVAIWSTPNCQDSNGNVPPVREGDGTACDLTNPSILTSDDGTGLVAKRNP